MKKMDEEILTEVQDGIQKVIFNRPKKRNAIKHSMYKKLVAILKEANSNDKIHMVVFTGNGEFFSSGNDMNMGNENSNPEAVLSSVKEFIDLLITFPKLLVAIVNGPAIGIAVTMLPLFDLVFASNKAFFQTPFSDLGFVAEGCSTYTFPRLMGMSKASEMLYLCYKMNANEAKQVGLISDIYCNDDPQKIWNHLNNVSKLSLESIVATKRLVRKWHQKLLLQVNEEEIKALIESIQSPEFATRVMNKMLRKNKL